MRRILRGRMTRLLAASVAVLATSAGIAVGAGVVAAPWQDAGGVYHACVTKAGTIRVIDTSLPPSSLVQHCTSLETEITWNQVGPQGAQGIQGLPGPQGVQGPQGPQGPAGADAGSTPPKMYSHSEQVAADDVFGGSSTVMCPNGMHAVSGGYTAPLWIDEFVIQNMPVPAPGSSSADGATAGGWTVHAYTRADTDAWNLTVYVMCV